MAITLGGLLAELYSTTDLTAYTSPAFTPSASSLLIAGHLNARATLGAAPTFSGGSLTWSAQQDRVTFGSIASPSYAVGWAWAVAPASPASMTVTMDFAGEVQTAGALVVFELLGADPTAPRIQGATAAIDTGSTVTATLGAGVAADSATIAVTGRAANNTLTPRTNWTEITPDAGGVSPAFRLQVQYRLPPSEDTGSSTAGASTQMGISVAEIAVAGAAGGITAAEMSPALRMLLGAAFIGEVRV
jgi:hypothetical protein